MRFMFDLSAGQTARILEQAIRRKAKITLESRASIDGTVLTLTPKSCDERFLLVESKSESPEDLESLIGMHMDAHLALGQTLYLFETHVVDVEACRSKSLILLARPESLQVTQRRRFRRMTLQAGCQVHLTVRGSKQPGTLTGKLLNLSPDGMACRLSEADAAMLDAGQAVSVAFHPQGSECGFVFDAVLANKSQAGSEGHVILGVQFRPKPHDKEAPVVRQRLCDFLYGATPALAFQEGDQ